MIEIRMLLGEKDRNQTKNQMLDVLLFEKNLSVVSFIVCYTHTHTHKHTHARTHAHTHTRTHAHTHTRTQNTAALSVTLRIILWGEFKKYSCLTKHKAQKKTQIFGNEMCVDYQ